MRDRSHLARAVKPLAAIPTVYAGTSYRSRFEADVAYLLTRLGLAFKYEPQGFLLDGGTHYLPDFFVASLRLWIECRGYESPKGERQIDGFAAMVRDGGVTADYLVIGSDRMGFYAAGREPAAPMLGRCRACQSWRFGGAASPSRCRACNKRGLDGAEFVEVVGGKVLVGGVFLETWARPVVPEPERPEHPIVRALKAAKTPAEEDALLAEMQNIVRARLAHGVAR